MASPGHNELMVAHLFVYHLNTFVLFFQNDIKTTNDELQQSSQSLVSKAEELVKCRKIQRNIASAVETLSVCLPVLEMYGKLREQMKNKR